MRIYLVIETLAQLIKVLLSLFQCVFHGIGLSLQNVAFAGCNVYFGLFSVDFGGPGLELLLFDFDLVVKHLGLVWPRYVRMSQIYRGDTRTDYLSDCLECFQGHFLPVPAPSLDL